MANTVEVVFQIDKDAQGRAVLRQIDTELNKIGATSKQTGTAIDSSLGFFKSAVIVEFFRRAASGAFEFGKASVAAFNEVTAAAKGLEAVAKFRGVDSAAAQEQVRNLQIVRDGLISFSDASLGLQNLLQRGFSLDQSIKLLQAFGDSAAFNRQRALTFGQAVVSTSEGIKNLNSILSDNGGITKNLSVILRERGFELQDIDDKVKGAAAREALYAGLIQETAAQTGNAARLAQTFAGEQARLEVQQKKVLEAIGALITSNPELLRGLQSAGSSFEYIALQLRDSESALSKFVESVTTKFGSAVGAAARLTNQMGLLLNVIDRIESAVGGIGTLLTFGLIKPTESAEDKNIKTQFSKLRELFLEEQKRLAEAAKKEPSEKPLTHEQDIALFRQLREEGTRALAELEAKNKAYAEAVRGSGDAVQDLANRLRINPIANLYDEALRRQRDFLERFKEVPKAIKDAFVKANADVLRLDLFKAQLGQAGIINNLLLEKAKLESGLGGKANLDDFDQERLARLERDALDAQLATARSFLAQATNPAQQQLANEQILSLTSGRALTSDQIQIRLKAVNDSLALQQKVFRENFERAKESLNAQKENTLALRAVDNKLSTVEGALTNFAQQPLTIKIENETTADVDTGEAFSGSRGR